MQSLDAALIASGVLHVTFVGQMMLATDNGCGRVRRTLVRGAGCVGAVTAVVAAMQVAEAGVALAVSTVIFGLVAGYGATRRGELRFAAALTWASLVVFGVLSLAWGVIFLATLDASMTTKCLLWAGLPFIAVGLPASAVTQRESLEVLLRKRWRRQRGPLLEPERERFPFVSIHVPCHSEPPRLVIATLDRLARLDYPDFEVLVIDNNTADEQLWRPVERHCARLGTRFRFLHVEGITGAKAGALNWAAPRVASRAELIAVVDADYHVDPRWLRSTIGFFDDPKIGFVQPPHAYRNWEHRRFGRMANWEYTMFFANAMVALQEHGAGITVGTMCVIRRRALEEAGGWARWCLTEDSELSIRIHALGYQSVYLREPMGWGLIPETFQAYRTQRFRWTYGPVQELRRHWRKFLPARLGGEPAYSPTQRLHHANHGLDVALVGIRALAWPFALAAGLSVVVHHEQIPVPFALWVAATTMLVSGLLIRWQQYCKVTRAPITGAIGAVIAYQALTHVITMASLSAVLGRKAQWHRTDKFAPGRSNPIAATRAETTIAATLMGSAATIFTFGAGAFSTMLAVGLFVQGLTYLSSLCVAWTAARDLVGSPAAPGDLVADGVPVARHRPRELVALGASAASPGP